MDGLGLLILIPLILVGIFLLSILVPEFKDGVLVLLYIIFLPILLLLLPLFLHEIKEREKNWQKMYDEAASEEEKRAIMLEASDISNM